MSQPSQNTFLEIGLLVLLSFLWGASFTLLEVAVDTIPPATIDTGEKLRLFQIWRKFFSYRKGPEIGEVVRPKPP